MAFGADITHAYGYQTVVSLPGFGSPVADAYAYSPAGRPDPRNANAGFNFPSRTYSSAVQSGYFASLRVERQPWSFILGLRVSNDRGSEATSLLILGQEIQTIKPERFANIGKVTPYVGTLYALDESWSLYASYADIYLPNAGYRSASGVPLHPADGVNIEAGLKGAWYDGALTGTIALYRTVQRGLPGYDPDASLPGLGCCYLPSGRITAKGMDIELSGSPAPGWLLSSGYTFNNNLSLIPYKFYGQETSETPRHLFKAWTSWQLPGPLSNWSVGGTLEARSSFFDGGLYCNVDASGRCTAGFQRFRDTQGSFVIVSPRVEYQIDRHWRVALSVANAFDRVYYQTIGGPPSGNWYGEPRNFLVRVDARL
jgi:outer-membrane receptor for ferric coprogen and ferric-rhodotorulic acid